MRIESRDSFYKLAYSSNRSSQTGTIHNAVQLRKRDYDFLRYDSFLGANNLLTRPIVDLVKSMQDGQTTIVGHLTDEDLTALLDACRKSDLFSNKEKKQFFY